MSEQRQGQHRDLVIRCGILAVAFVVLLGLSWSLCAWLGHPRDGANRWVVCTAFATVVTGAFGELGRRRNKAAPGHTSVSGHDNRVAGAAAHDNTFGDRSNGAGKSTPTARPKKSLPSPAEEAPLEGGGTDVNGSRNRVAGTGAHHNDFGDEIEGHDHS